jgi:hypothetical protein
MCVQRDKEQPADAHVCSVSPEEKHTLFLLVGDLAGVVAQSWLRIAFWLFDFVVTVASEIFEVVFPCGGHDRMIESRSSIACREWPVFLTQPFLSGGPERSRDLKV